MAQNNMAATIENIKRSIGLLRQFLIPRAFTPRLIEFAENERIFFVIREIGKSGRAWTRQEFYDAVQKCLKYKTEDAARKRMLAVLLDFLEECGFISMEGSYIYLHDREAKSASPLSPQDMENMEKMFHGQSVFLEKCIDYAADFLRGGDPLYSFNKDMGNIWNGFLGNYEFSIARDIMLKAMIVDKISDCKILDLCYGTGHGLKLICRDLPDADIAAIDFTNDMREFVMIELGVAASKIKWVDGDAWKGFGQPLPFEAMTFDRIFFSCGDPYIQESLRNNVYRDIFRILKPGGILGVVAWGYPDKGRTHIRNEWIRKGIYIHDFAESVCKGWHGFRDIDNTVQMAREIGFVQSNAVLGNFYMLDTAVWMFRRP